MRTWYYLPLLAVVACRSGPHPKRAAAPLTDTATISTLFRAPRDSVDDHILRTPRVITKPSVVVFWLHAGDSLSHDSAKAASRDLGFYTEQVAATLADNGIALIPTTADTVFVEQPDHRHRAIILSGLDYPYGYLLIDPGTPERILTGIYDDDDLLDELHAYFDLPDDSDSTESSPRVIT